MQQDHLDNPMLCLPLRLDPCLRIDLKCGSAICMPHEFLHDLHVLPVRHQQGGEAAPERVPADMLPVDRPLGWRDEDLEMF